MLTIDQYHISFMAVIGMGEGLHNEQFNDVFRSGDDGTEILFPSQFLLRPLAALVQPLLFLSWKRSMKNPPLSARIWMACRERLMRGELGIFRRGLLSLWYILHPDLALRDGED